MVAAALDWLGTADTFAAHAVLWRGRVRADFRRYAWLDVVGGSMAGTASALYRAWPSAASNFVWAAVGLPFIVFVLRKQNPSEQAVVATAG